MGAGQGVKISERAREIAQQRFNERFLGARIMGSPETVNAAMIQSLGQALDEYQAIVDAQLKALRAAVIPTGNYSRARVDAFIEGKISRAELIGPVTIAEFDPAPDTERNT